MLLVIFFIITKLNTMDHLFFINNIYYMNFNRMMMQMRIYCIMKICFLCFYIFTTLKKVMDFGKTLKFCLNSQRKEDKTTVCMMSIDNIGC